MLGADDIRALNGITAEKDGLPAIGSETLWFCVKGDVSYPVQTNDIIITLGGVELDGETSRVARRVGEFSTEGDGTESNEDGCLLAGLLKKVGLAIHIYRQYMYFCPLDTSSMDYDVV